ncbi:MAG: hypothetical protein QXE22_07220 [Candidatus Bathyarchaeia archaeon]
MNASTSKPASNPTASTVKAETTSTAEDPCERLRRDLVRQIAGAVVEAVRELEEEGMIRIEALKTPKKEVDER